TPLCVSPLTLTYTSCSSLSAPPSFPTRRSSDLPEQGALALGALGPEVDQDHAHAVEGVEEDRADEADLAEAEHDRLVVPDHLVVGLGGDADESGVQDVHEQEQEDEHS